MFVGTFVVVVAIIAMWVRERWWTWLKETNVDRYVDPSIHPKPNLDFAAIRAGLTEICRFA